MLKAATAAADDRVDDSTTTSAAREPKRSAGIRVSGIVQLPNEFLGRILDHDEDSAYALHALAWKLKIPEKPHVLNERDMAKRIRGPKRSRFGERKFRKGNKLLQSVGITVRQPGGRRVGGRGAFATERLATWSGGETNVSADLLYGCAKLLAFVAATLLPLKPRSAAEIARRIGVKSINTCNKLVKQAVAGGHIKAVKVPGGWIVGRPDAVIEMPSKTSPSKSSKTSPSKTSPSKPSRTSPSKTSPHSKPLREDSVPLTEASVPLKATTVPPAGSTVPPVVAQRGCADDLDDDGTAGATDVVVRGAQALKAEFGQALSDQLLQAKHLEQLTQLHDRHGEEVFVIIRDVCLREVRLGKLRETTGWVKSWRYFEEPIHEALTRNAKTSFGIRPGDPLCGAFRNKSYEVPF
jgi:hypothetical protein